MKSAVVPLALALCSLGNTVIARGQSPPMQTGDAIKPATDALGRELPGFDQVGAVRANKFVGVFYFLWLGEHGDAGPFDITKILAADPDAANNPDSPLWGPVGTPHHWGESVFGYYRSDDEWVLRKHAQMLADAGVDTVIFDTTNQLTYPRSYRALCRVWSQIRREGGRTPQIAFLTPFGDPSAVVQTLYEEFYQPGLYADLWFRWENKPLLLADPNFITPERLRASQRVPGLLHKGETVGQSFVADRPFTAVGGSFPTYNSTTSGMTLSLYTGGTPGTGTTTLVAQKRFTNVADNATILLELPAPAPPGVYYLEQSEPEGAIGWWSQTGKVYEAGRAFSNRIPDRGGRSLFARRVGETAPTQIVGENERMVPTAASAEAQAIRDFFTFRKPQPDYFSGPTGPGQWGWLDVSPQKPYYRTPGGPPEEVTVGVAQNALDDLLSVLSNPRAHGRSFHDGMEPSPPGRDYTGRNFAEQWDRALQLDPSFLFITGWNEWIASRFNADAPFAGATPVTFVDEFDAEFSRDIEPVTGGHGDDYYYQMIAGIRRYKGIPAPLPPTPPLQKPPSLDDFAAWRQIGAAYQDDTFDTTHRDHPAWSAAIGPYRNDTGRNDFVTLRAGHDARNVYLYARAREPIREFDDPQGGAMSLLLRTEKAGGSAAPTWLGFDYIIHRQRGKRDGVVTLERSLGGWVWKTVSDAIPCRVNDSEMALIVPRALLGLGDTDKPLRLDFKWLDNVRAEDDPLNLYRNGDTAPNGRFRYRYVGAAQSGQQ